MSIARSVGETDASLAPESSDDTDDNDEEAEATAHVAHDGSAIGRCSATREFLSDGDDSELIKYDAAAVSAVVVEAEPRQSRTAVVCGASAIETISQR
jgi:hypothetical protein